jgi:hypothetical protein
MKLKSNRVNIVSCDARVKMNVFGHLVIQVHARAV